MTQTAKMLRRITPKTICEERKIDLLNMPRPVPGQVLYDLFGVINDFRIPKKTLDDAKISPQFLGRFNAVTPEGEEFISGKTHIPVLEEMIHSTLVSAKERDPRASIEIALRVAIVPAMPGKPSMTGYEYDVQRLVDTPESPDDPIARLKAEARAKALPAPDKSTSTAPAAPAVSAQHVAPAPAAEPSHSKHTTGGKRR